MCSAQRSKMPRGFCTFPIFSSILKTKPKIYTYTLIYIILYLLSNQRWWHITHPKSAEAIIFPSSTSTHCTNIWNSLILWRTHTFLNSSYTHEIPMWPTITSTIPYLLYTLVERANITSTTHLPKHKDKETSHQNWTIYTHTYRTVRLNSHHQVWGRQGRK